MKYRKKPVVIEAERWTQDNRVNVMIFTKELGEQRCITSLEPLCMEIRTLEGVMEANEGDWIIKGVKGEFYPCKPDIFEATYEEVEDDFPDDDQYDHYHGDQSRHDPGDQYRDYH